MRVRQMSESNGRKTVRVPFPITSSLKVTGAYGTIIAPHLPATSAPLPYMMTFVVTRRCNSKCQMCNIWQEKRPLELTLDQIDALFRPGFPFVQSLTLTGGEAALRTDLPEIFSIAAERMPNLLLLYLATSGLNTRLVLGHLQRILQQVESNPRRLRKVEVQVSLDGVGDVHDEIRGIPGYFKAVMATVDGIRRMQASHPRLNYHLHMVVMPKNMGAVPAVKELARSLGVRVTFSPIVISSEYYRNESQSQDLLFATRSAQSAQVSRLLGELANEEIGSLKYHYRDVAGIVEGAPRKRRCMQGFYAFVLEHDGSVYPCVNYELASFGNLLRESFADIWFSERAIQVRREVAEKGCPACPAMCYTSSANLGELAATTARTAARKLLRGR